jgi:ATP-binding cassette subfamily B protein
MAREGHYYRLYQAQARNVDTEPDSRRPEIDRKVEEGRE